MIQFYYVLPKWETVYKTVNKIPIFEREIMKVVFDVETTGLVAGFDEILQFSAIDEMGNILMNTYLKPTRKKTWPEAKRVNGISPEMVSNAPCFSDVKGEIQMIFDNASELITYNGRFDIGFLSAAGIKFMNIPSFDLMLAFAPIYGEWKKLTTCADYYGYKFNAHDSLEDVRATLYCYKKIVGLT